MADVLHLMHKQQKQIKLIFDGQVTAEEQANYNYGLYTHNQLYISYVSGGLNY